MYKTWVQLKKRIWNGPRWHSFIEAFDKGRNLLKETALMTGQKTVYYHFRFKVHKKSFKEIDRFCFFILVVSEFVNILGRHLMVSSE